ncbi:bifunctional DNA primase/helicase, partial [Bacteroides hominis]
ENTKHKAVLLYDTEQSEVQLFKNVTNLIKRAKQTDKPDEFKAFCLTGMSRKERLHAIVQSMDRYYFQYGGIQLVVIDGIADLVRCANDEAESVAIIDELYRLAGIYKTCIICVLHFVPNGLKLRGHLGSELQRKAAAILSIEKDEDPALSVVKALKVRDGSPLDVPLMLFSWDKVAGMHLYRGEKTREEKEKRKEKELVGVARDVFGRQEHITYIDLCEQIQQILDVKERTAKSYIRFMRERDIIIKDPSNQSYFMIGII